MLLFSHSVVSDSLRPHGLQPTRLLCPWDSPGKNTGVSCHFFLRKIFPDQGLNLCLLHWQAEPLGKPPNSMLTNTNLKLIKLYNPFNNSNMIFTLEACLKTSTTTLTGKPAVISFIASMHHLYAWKIHRRARPVIAFSETLTTPCKLSGAWVRRHTQYAHLKLPLRGRVFLEVCLLRFLWICDTYSGHQKHVLSVPEPRHRPFPLPYNTFPSFPQPPKPPRLSFRFRPWTRFPVLSSPYCGTSLLYCYTIIACIVECSLCAILLSILCAVIQLTNTTPLWDSITQCART